MGDNIAINFNEFNRKNNSSLWLPLFPYDNSSVKSVPVVTGVRTEYEYGFGY